MVLFRLWRGRRDWQKGAKLGGLGMPFSFASSHRVQGVATLNMLMLIVCAKINHLPTYAPGYLTIDLELLFEFLFAPLREHSQSPTLMFCRTIM